jgi:ATP-dependent Clp protease ATP-binding subunit ClpA
MPEEDKFTPRARQALIFATQEALRLRHPAARPEHILLGLLREGTGLATLALSRLGIDPVALRAAIEERLPGGDKPVRGEVDYSPEAKQVFALAVEEARRLGHHYLGQEHLLLALLRQPDGAAAEVLADSYVAYEVARAQVVALLSSPKPGHRETKVKRYNLALPEDLFRRVEELAEREHTTVLEVLRRSVKLGLLAAEVQQTPGASLVIREGTSERQLVLL